MSIDKEKLETLQVLLDTVNQSITKKDFVASFRAVYNFVKQIKEHNDTELSGIKSEFTKLSNSLTSNSAEEIKAVKSTVNTILKDSIAEMWVEHDAKMQQATQKIAELRDGIDGEDGQDGADGKDADENAIIQRVITMVPSDTPVQIVKKLETLTGDERLDASAIKNLPEFRGRMGGGLSKATADALYAPIGSVGGTGAVDSVNGETGAVILTTGDIAEDTDANYVSDAQLVILGNTSGTNTGDQTTIVGITGTKAQFNTAVSDGDILFVGDITGNATHTGEVTGATALTVDKTAISNKSTVTAALGDTILIGDASDSNNLKKVTVQTVVDLASGSGIAESLAIAYAVSL